VTSWWPRSWPRTPSAFEALLAQPQGTLLSVAVVGEAAPLATYASADGLTWTQVGDLGARAAGGTVRVTDLARRADGLLVAVGVDLGGKARGFAWTAR
jgi:hypothetical protein